MKRLWFQGYNIDAKPGLQALPISKSTCCVDLPIGSLVVPFRDYLIGF